MKKLFKSAALIAASFLLTVNFSSCNKDPQNNTEEANKATKEAIVKQYLNHTVYPTYTNLANEADKLVENLEALKASQTQANVNTAAATFINARHWWEMSEAFLFGAASDFGIDPHIDSWSFAGCSWCQRHLEHHQRDAPHQDGSLHDRRLRHQGLTRPRGAG